MVYLSGFRFPDYDREYDFRLSAVKRTCYNSIYPFFVLSRHELCELDFEPVTILYGGNGSGKSTALNVIAEKLKLKRDSKFNRSDFFGDYVDMCGFSAEKEFGGRIITSDDVFDFMLNVRSINEGIEQNRERLFEEYAEMKYSEFKVSSLDDYERLKKVCDSRRKTQSKYVRARNPEDIREYSNGESAFNYFTDKIKDNGLYLLDEPENSLSPERQIRLAKFLEEAARFYNCQLVIATHSPFLLAMRGTKIYDLDDEPVSVKRWTELKNVKEYYEFFKKHSSEFDK